jgi:hypothetical protein
MTTRSIGPLLCGSLLLLAVLMPVAAPAAPTGGVCNPTKVKYLASDVALFKTSSTSFVNVAQASISFVQGGNLASCVIVRFSAQPFVAVSGNTLIVGAFLDNATAALPNEVTYTEGGSLANTARSFDFVFPSVAPGNHVVRMQFKSPSGASVDLGLHNTFVQYAP